MSDLFGINANEVLVRLAETTARYIRSNVQPSAEHQSLAATMARDLDRVGDGNSKVGRPSPRVVRGLQYAPEAFARLSGSASELEELTQAALAAFGYVNWSEFYAEDDWSRPFLSRFANGEGVGPDGVLIREDVILGLFIMGPDAFYPAHAHPATEFYIPLSGGAAFQVGAENPFVARTPGDLILHRENESHAIRTGKDPLFAIFGWTGAISEASWYREDMTDRSAPIHHPTIAKG